MSTSTPRTDAAFKKYTLVGGVPNELHGDFANLARTLETELTALTAEAASNSKVV